MCVVPLASRLMSRMLTLHVQTYMRLNQHEDMQYHDSASYNSPGELALQDIPGLFPDPGDYDG